MTRPPAVPEQVHVELELLAARGELEHRVVELLEGRALAEEAQTRPHPGHVRVDRDVAHPVREEQDARGGLAADAGEGYELLSGRGDAQSRQVLVERGDVDVAQDRLDPRGLDLAD